MVASAAAYSFATIGKPEDNTWVFACLGLFLVAGFLEIVGGWFIWSYVKENKPLWWALVGSALLIGYGFVPTLQPAEAGEFGRVYAAYGCYFIVLSLGWAWAVESQKPDTGDLLGCALATVGAGLITFWPRPA